MQRLALFCCAAVLAACAKSENRAASDGAPMDTAAMAPEPAAAPAAISLADIAGAALPAPVKVVTVSDRPEMSTFENLKLLPKWDHFDHLVDEVEAAYASPL